MKVLNKKINLLILPLIFFILYPAVNIKADQGYLIIGQYNVKAELQKSGDMVVEENVEFDFNGSYNGATKQILLPEEAGIENITVSEGNNAYKKVEAAAKGNKGVFTVENKQNNSYMLWIYSPAENTKRSFKITYLIKNACKKYNDTGELYWKFISTENQTPIEKVSIDIILPTGSQKNDIKLFAHGPLTGESAIRDDSTVNLSINNLPAGRYVEARILFPTNLIPGAKRVVAEDKLQSILQEESNLADKANDQRNQARSEINNPIIHDNYYQYNDNEVNGDKESFVSGLLVFIFIASAIIIFVVMKSKYGTDPIADFNGEYYRELPDDYTPAVMSMLYYRRVSQNDMTATLMNLIRKRYLKLEVIDIEEKGIFKAKHKKDYLITRINNKIEKLMSHEQYLINWLLEDFGDGNSFTFQDVRDQTKKSGAAQRFNDKFYKWKQKVKNDSLEFKFWEESSFFTKRTQYGANQYARWRAFKNFLRDFSNLKEAEVPSLVLWEHYLVYAISLDIAKRVLDQLKIIIPSEDLYNGTNMNMLTYLYISDAMYGHEDIFQQFNDISSSFTELTDSAISIANSHDSSSTGSGGGFSGGGFDGGSSGGGGGDGGGGFGGF